MGNFIKNDISIVAMSLDGQEIPQTPEKKDYIVNVECDKKAEAYWDTDIWGLVVKDFEKGIKCSVDFETKYLTNYIKYLAKSSDELLVDETEDKNLRYIGANPNNYVSFNNELWRIVGVMNDIEDGEGNKEARVKIVRVGNIGEYSWDYKSDGSYGDAWTNATLKDLLNGPYYNRSTGTYYNYVANTEPTPTTLDFTEKGLSEAARNQIGIASWYVGDSYEKHTKNAYTLDKKNLWYGNVGLLSPSDVLYSVSGNESIDRNTCLTERLYNWRTQSEFSECAKMQWIATINTLGGSAWTINRNIDVPKSLVYNLYYGSTLYIYAKAKVSPSVYLKSNVYYVSGTGSSTDPFIIQ